MFDLNFDILKAYAPWPMFIIWYKQQFMAHAIQHSLNDEVEYNSNLNNEIKDKLEAKNIILKYFTKYLYLQE